MGKYDAILMANVLRPVGSWFRKMHYVTKDRRLVCSYEIDIWHFGNFVRQTLYDAHRSSAILLKYILSPVFITIIAC